MRSTATLIILLTGSVVLDAGCSGAGGGGAAACAGPCGGDVTGDWTFSGVCVDAQRLAESFRQSCPQGVIKNARGEATGTVAFRSDNTYQLTYAETISYGIDIPASASCYGATTCADLETRLREQDDSFSCSGSSTCACTFNEPSSGAETGTYTVSDTSLTITSSDFQTKTWLHCARGDSLSLREGLLTYAAQRTTR